MRPCVFTESFPPSMPAANTPIRIELPAGEVLFREGDPPTTGFLLESGEIEVAIRIRGQMLERKSKTSTLTPSRSRKRSTSAPMPPVDSLMP